MCTLEKGEWNNTDVGVAEMQGLLLGGDASKVGTAFLLATGVVLIVWIIARWSN